MIGSGIHSLIRLPAWEMAFQFPPWERLIQGRARVASARCWVGADMTGLGSSRMPPLIIFGLTCDSYTPGQMNVTEISSRLPRAALLAVLLLVLATPFAFLGWRLVTLILLAASAIATAQSSEGKDRLDQILELGGFGSPALTAARMIVLLALGSAVWTDSAIVIPFVCAAILMTLLMVPARVVTDRLEARLGRTVFTRNLGGVAVDPPPAVANYLASGIGLAIAEIILFCAGALLTGQLLLAWSAAIVAVGLLAFTVLATALATRRIGEPYRGAVLAATHRALAGLSPKVALYVGSGDASNLYQTSMWLSALERVQEPTVILMRSRKQFAVLGPTATPVVCVPVAADFLSLELTTLRAGLFVANTGDVIHLIREPSLMSAFIGHGDSDKNSSANPFAKVYDEIWLAGEAGADRYRRANVGVRDDQFVFVGRPQLDAISSATGQLEPGEPPTVLYAPTWEGWNLEQQYSSLLGQAINFVQAALDSPTPLRLIYKPHPFTGRRLANARTAHQRIVSMLARANAANKLPSAPSQVLPADQRRELDGLSAIAGDELLARFSRDFWRRTDPRTHVVVEHGDVGLYDCFNAASFMAADVSSVLSDFMASDKPFAVFNTSSLPDDVFVDQFPSASAGTVISADGSHIPEVIDIVTGAAPDRQRWIRAAQHELLLGPPQPPATERFASAVSALVDRAEERQRPRVADDDSA